MGLFHPEQFRWALLAIPILLLSAALEERRKLESVYAASEALHGAVLASIQDQMVVLDRAGRR